MILAALASVGGQPQNGEPDGTRQQFVDSDPLKISVQGIQKSANAKTFFLEAQQYSRGHFFNTFSGAQIVIKKGTEFVPPKLMQFLPPKLVAEIKNGGQNLIDFWGQNLINFWGHKFGFIEKQFISQISIREDTSSPVSKKR